MRRIELKRLRELLQKYWRSYNFKKSEEKRLCWAIYDVDNQIYACNKRSLDKKNG